jgi:hypothetical protein
MELMRRIGAPLGASTPANAEQFNYVPSAQTGDRKYTWIKIQVIFREFRPSQVSTTVVVNVLHTIL